MLAPYQPNVVLCSEQPKARETAEAIAGRLSTQTAIVEGLHEHRRDSVPFMEGPEYEKAVASLFARPTELVMGDETAQQAQRRFAGAIETIISDRTEGDIVVVSHGTVIALYVAGVANVEPLRFWHSLGLPSYVVLSMPGMKLLETVEKVV